MQSKTELTSHYKLSNKPALAMVKQCVNLFENDVSRGTLFVSVDDSKYLIKFYECIKVEVLLEEEMCGPRDASISKFNEPTSLKNSESEECGRLGDYIDLSQFSSDQGYSETSQKIIKADDGQYLTITTINPALASESTVSEKNVQRVEIFGDATNDGDDNAHRGKKALIDSDNENAANQNEIGQLDTTIVVKTESDHSYHDARFPNNTEVNIQDFSLDVTDVLSAEGLIKKENVSGDCDDVPVKFNLKRKAAPVHSCRDCFATFESTQAMKDHRKVKDFNEYQCDECSEMFQFQGFLEVHKLSNHGSVGPPLVYKDKQYWYSCHSCSMLIKSLVKLQIHYLTHTGEGIFQCCRCPEKFGEKRDFNQHMKDHKSSGMVRCHWCSKWFADKSALAKHKLICKVIKCHLCDNIFPNKTSRNQHYKDFHPDDILKCNLCSYMFSSQQDLDNHMIKHSKSKKKQCTLCGLFFSRLKKHMLVHKNPNEYTESEIYYCDKCPAKFTNQATFSRHWKSHTGEKPYQCPNCPRTFANCGVLYKHIKRHKSLLPYTCEVCSKTCASIDELKSHMKTHSDDNLLFPCSICTQAFMYKNSLEAHIQMKHSQSFSNVDTNLVDDSNIKTGNSYNVTFSDNTNALMGVVIQGISSLISTQETKYEVVVEK